MLGWTLNGRTGGIGNSSNDRLILDNGLQESYISRRVQKQLNPQPVITDKVLTEGFGDTAGTLKQCDLVKLAVRGSVNSIVNILAYVLDTCWIPFPIA